MSVRVTIDEVVPYPARQGLVAHGIDQPSTGSSEEEYAVTVAGWVLGSPTPVSAVEVVVEDRVVKTAPVQLLRPDVEARHPVLGRLPSGYSTRLGLVGLPAETTLELRAVLIGDRRVPLGHVTLRRARLELGASSSYQSLMVTSLGRMGTTWLMRLLAEHPSIVAHRAYPYELMTGRYWAHQLRVLSAPAEPATSSPDTFADDVSRVGANPFYGPMVHEAPALRRWLGGAHVERMAGFCTATVDEFYGELARVQGQRPAGFFAEKFLPDHLPTMMWELYPGAREVVLVRDIRDVVCSMLAFNAKRGNQSFGRDKAHDDREFVHNLARDLGRLRRSWERRAADVELVRYEELVLEPRAVLRRVLGYAGLEHDDATIGTMLDGAAEVNAGLEAHRTSAGPRESIGRWRQDLAPELADACSEEMHDTLAAFGYESVAA